MNPMWEDPTLAARPDQRHPSTPMCRSWPRTQGSPHCASPKKDNVFRTRLRRRPCQSQKQRGKHCASRLFLYLGFRFSPSRLSILSVGSGSTAVVGLSSVPFSPICLFNFATGKATVSPTTSGSRVSCGTVPAPSFLSSPTFFWPPAASREQSAPDRTRQG